MSAALLVSGDRVSLLDLAGAGEPAGFEFQVVARRGSEGDVAFDLEGDGSPDEVTIGALGDRLADESERDLIDELTARFFALLLCRRPPSEAPRLLYPPWMGPVSRRRLRTAARAVGFELQDGVERGLALLVAHLRRNGGDPPIGGWLLADRCGSDLDLYQLDDAISSGSREIGLRSYRRLRGLLGAYYSGRPSEREERLRGAVADVPSGAGWLVTDDELSSLLAETTGGTTVLSADWRIVEELDRPSDGTPLQWRRSPSHWLSVGDQQLEPLPADKDSGSRRTERLYRIPHLPPQALIVGLRAGYGASLAETYSLASIRLRRGSDYRALEGWLLVAVERGTGAARTLEVEVVQAGTTSVRRTVQISPEHDDD